MPISVLDYDGHCLGEAFQQVAGNVHAWRAGAEGDVEMMAAGQAASGLHLAKHAADDGAQRILHDLVIGDRKRVVSGTSVSVSVDLGGGRIIKNKTKVINKINH